MNVIIFEEASYYKMLDEFAKMVKDAAKETKEDEQWISREKAMEILNCKKSKLQQLRDNEEIEFSKDGRIITYFKPSLYACLKRKMKH